MECEFALRAGTLRLTVDTASDRGLVRRVNEDSFLALPPVFLVADGMGGHAFGDRASQSVAATFAAQLGDGTPPSADAVVATIRAANTAVVALAAGDGDGAVSGTTLAGVALVEAHSSHHWMTFNVGDSRVYSWDGRELEQVTVDHSAVQELLDLGQITELEALVHPQQNMVTRAIGVHAEVDPDIWLLPVGGHQLFLVCSDGLTKELADDQIADIVRQRHSLPEGETVADRLVRAALAAGGRDNVTVVVVDAALEGAVSWADAATNDRFTPAYLEETRPRK